jgi:acyl-coenzyme A thioesterase PaaI-like protein
MTPETVHQRDFMARVKANDVAIARLIGFEATEIAEGRAMLTLAAGPQHANPMGTLHGGVLCDVADAAMGIAGGGQSRAARKPDGLHGVRNHGRAGATGREVVLDVHGAERRTRQGTLDFLGPEKPHFSGLESDYLDGARTSDSR